MKSLEQQLKRLKQLTELIREGNTGTPQELAAKLGVSKRFLYFMFDFIKSYDVEITYDRKLKTYLFNGDKELFVESPMKVMDKDDMQKINGGSIIGHNYTFFQSFLRSVIPFHYLRIYL